MTRTGWSPLLRLVVGAALLGWLSSPLQPALHAQSVPSASDTPEHWEFRAAISWLELDPRKGSSIGSEFSFVRDRPLFWRLQPLGGVVVSTIGQGFAYGGLGLTLAMNERIEIRPSVAAGYYSRGAGPELGSRLEFRSALSIEAALTRNLALSMFVYHLSNGGLGVRNPGLEALGLGLTVPLR